MKLLTLLGTTLQLLVITQPSKSYTKMQSFLWMETENILIIMQKPLSIGAG